MCQEKYLRRCVFSDEVRARQTASCCLGAWLRRRCDGLVEVALDQVATTRLARKPIAAMDAFSTLRNFLSFGYFLRRESSRFCERACCRRDTIWQRPRPYLVSRVVDGKPAEMT